MIALSNDRNLDYELCTFWLIRGCFYFTAVFGHYAIDDRKSKARPAAFC